MATESVAAACPYNIAPAYTFSKSARYRTPYKTPGPFDYSPARSYYNPSYSISRSRRILSNYKDISPGPGYYRTDSGISKYKFFMSKTPSRNVLNNTPGPGLYQVKTSRNFYKAPKFSFAGASKFPKIKSEAPAPGSYEIKSIFGGPKYSISKAKKGYVIKAAPGPGYYEIPSTIGIASLRRKLKYD